MPQRCTPQCWVQRSFAEPPPDTSCAPSSICAIPRREVDHPPGLGTASATVCYATVQEPALVAHHRPRWAPKLDEASALEA